MSPQPDQQHIAGVLKQFGFNARQAQIYCQALAYGPATVQELARYMQQNRVTIHSAAQELIEKGLFYEARKGKRRLLVAEDPTVLHRLLERKAAEVDLIKPSIDYVVQSLGAIRRTDRSMPSVKFYEGVDGLKRMLDETLNAKSEVLVFTYVDIFSQLLTPSYLENYYKRRAAKGIATRLIFPLAPFGKRVNQYAQKYRMQVRFLEPALTWKSGIFSWNNVIAIQSFTEGKVTCTIIENEDIAHFYRSVIFELCWSQAKILKT